MMQYHQYPYGPHDGWFSYNWAIVAAVLGTILLLVVLYYLFRSYGIQGKKDALEILKERYAKGEITKEEFEEMKKNLEK